MRVVTGLVAGLAVTLFWVWVTVEGAAVPQHPHDVPVAVVGPRPAVTELAAALEGAGAFQVIAQPSEAAALDLVERREADAIVNLDTSQLETAQAASSFTGIALEQALSSESTVQLQTREIKPFEAGDPTGMGLFFIAMALVLGGLPSGIALTFLSKTRRPASLADAGVRVLLTLAFSALLALLVALIADASLGYGGTQMLVIWGWGTLLSAASMVTAAALVGGVGIPGVLLTAIPILFLGASSSPIPSPWNWQSDFFRVASPFNPFGATVNGVRNDIFFGPASQTQNFVVLAVWIAVPVLLLTAMGWRSQRVAGATVASARGLRPKTAA